MTYRMGKDCDWQEQQQRQQDHFEVGLAVGVPMLQDLHLVMQKDPERESKDDRKHKGI